MSDTEADPAAAAQLTPPPTSSPEDTEADEPDPALNQPDLPEVLPQAPQAPQAPLIQIPPQPPPVPPPPIMAQPPEVTGSQMTATNIYDGTEDIEIYFAHVERNRIQFRWTPEQTAAVVKNKLKGEAASWLHFLTQTHKITDTWAQLQVLMRERFQLEFNEQTARKAVMNLNQKDNETVNAFFERITDAMDKKNHAYTIAEKQDDAYQDALMRDVYTFFSAGMKAEIIDKAMAGADPPRTAANLLRAARIVEIQFEKERSSKLLNTSAAEVKLPDKQAEEVPKAKTLEQEVALLQEGFKGLRNSLQTNRGGFRGRNFRGRGFYGGNRGSTRPFGQRGGGNPFSRPPPSTITCFRCNGQGHYSYQCPTGGQQGSGGQQAYNRGRGRTGRTNEVEIQDPPNPWYEYSSLN